MSHLENLRHEVFVQTILCCSPAETQRHDLVKHKSKTNGSTEGNVKLTQLRRALTPTLSVISPQIWPKRAFNVKGNQLNCKMCHHHCSAFKNSSLSKCGLKVYKRVKIQIGGRRLNKPTDSTQGKWRKVIGWFILFSPPTLRFPVSLSFSPSSLALFLWPISMKIQISWLNWSVRSGTTTWSHSALCTIVWTSLRAKIHIRA